MADQNDLIVPFLQLYQSEFHYTTLAVYQTQASVKHLIQFAKHLDFSRMDHTFGLVSDLRTDKRCQYDNGMVEVEKLRYVTVYGKRHS